MNITHIRAVQERQYREIVAALSASRKAAGLSQAELAATIGITQSAFSKIEACERRLDPVEYAWLTQKLGICTGDEQLGSRLIGLARSE